MRRLNGIDALMLYFDGGSAYNHGVPGIDCVNAINEYLNERLAGYKRPRVVVQVDAIKRAANGKPDYPWARNAVLNEVARAASPA